MKVGFVLFFGITGTFTSRVRPYHHSQSGAPASSGLLSSWNQNGNSEIPIGLCSFQFPTGLRKNPNF